MSELWLMLAGVAMGVALASIFRILFNERTKGGHKCFWCGAERQSYYRRRSERADSSDNVTPIKRPKRD